MYGIAFGDQLRLGALLAGYEARALLAALYSSPFYRWRFSGPVPERLTVAPQDLRTADPTIAADIYAGRFSLEGETAESGGQSPFHIDPPSSRWLNTLHGFGWLRHLRAADTELSRIHSRSLIDDWLTEFGRWDPIAWKPEVTARRLISWLCHSPLILSGADAAFYRRFLRSLSRQARYLYRTAGESGEGAPRLLAAMALCYAGLCMSCQSRLQRHAGRWLDEELERQILPDGGHTSRNPAVIIDVLLDLLPLRQTFLACNVAPTSRLMSAIDRMMPMLRFFRHGDGVMAHFNGMGPTHVDLMATVLAYDDTRGAPPSEARHSGYQRLESATADLIMDTGTPPPPLQSGEAHAGCLSFELCADGARLVINCGAPAHGDPRWRGVARATAAHSTATIADTSSARFAASDWVCRRVGSVVTAGPGAVRAERHDDADALAVSASHDGYVAPFGYIHERRLVLSRAGDRLTGEDSFHQAGDAGAEDPEFAIRFHLHPTVRASRTTDGERVVLITTRNSAWEFFASGAEITVEESIYLGGIEGPRRSSQIVLNGRCRSTPSVSWRFDRMARPSRRGQQAQPRTEELPLDEPDADDAD